MFAPNWLASGCILWRWKEVGLRETTEGMNIPSGQSFERFCGDDVGGIIAAGGKCHGAQLRTCGLIHRGLLPPQRTAKPVEAGEPRLRSVPFRFIKKDGPEAEKPSRPLVVAEPTLACAARRSSST